MRQIVLDTETTGLAPEAGHKLTEIGCLEIIDRKITGNTYQTYLNPERELDEGAARITGLTEEFLADKPKFVDIAGDFLAFIDGAELIIHNAPFDVGFINHELGLINHSYQDISINCKILDTLILARKKYPGQRNSLDALCKRLNIDNSNRTYHGALLDSEILAKVYLTMTAGQTKLDLMASNLEDRANNSGTFASANIMQNGRKNQNQNQQQTYNLAVIKANKTELAEHEKMLELINSNCNEGAVWER